MYSRLIVEQNITRVTDAERARRSDPRFRIVRFPADVIAEMCEHLQTTAINKDSLAEDGTFTWSRPLTAEEQFFIDNELTLSTLDFEHWANHYCTIQLSALSDKPEGWEELYNDAHSDSGKSSGLGPFLFNGMQVAMMHKLAALEEIAWDQYRRKMPVNGILLITLKARRLGASTMWQALLRHRTNFYHNYPALTASVDSDATQALHSRSDIMWEKMPVWMRARIKQGTKLTGRIEFANGSVIELQDFKQQKDLGKQEAWFGFHGTEMSSIPQVVGRDRWEDHFDEGLFPTIPYDRRVLFGMESTAKGKSGGWYEFCTSVMSGTAEGGSGRFTDFFAPFYLIDAYDEAQGQRSKYRLEPPADWTPSRDTQLVAERVYDTSHIYTPNHQKVRLDKQVLYWYELTRQQYFRKGRLNIFKQSYPIEPVDAFQHSAAGAFTNETIDRLQNICALYNPIPYRLMTEDELPEVEQYADALARPIHHAGGFHLGPMHPDELDDAHKDPRGIVWLYEQPSPHAIYAGASDPAGGIPRWSRQARTQDDVKKDNGTVQIWRKERSMEPCANCHALGWLPTDQPNQKGVQLECVVCEGRGRTGGRAVQVVDFAAPLDPEDLALYAFVLGRIFRGASDMDECELIVNRISIGVLTIRTLQNRYSYTNLWQTEAVADGTTIRVLDQIGFYEHPSTVPMLHSRGRLLIVRRDMEPRSKWLVKELGDAVVRTVGAQSEKGGGTLRTYERFVVPPGPGRHDDRMITQFLAGWVLFPVRDGDDLAETPAQSAIRDLPPHIAALANRELASTDASAADQSRIWNELAGALLADQDIHMGHFPDCAADCDSAHHPSIEELAWYDPDRDPDGLDGEGGEDQVGELGVILF
jgi:hypothetical protein